MLMAAEDMVLVVLVVLVVESVEDVSCNRPGTYELRSLYTSPLNTRPSTAQSHAWSAEALHRAFEALVGGQSWWKRRSCMNFISSGLAAERLTALRVV